MKDVNLNEVYSKVASLADTDGTGISAPIVSRVCAGLFDELYRVGCENPSLMSAIIADGLNQAKERSEQAS